MTFSSVLIANRGEIALRIQRIAKALGLRTIAVCSDADRDALHVRHADAVMPIGPAPSAESYLSIERILDAARKSGAEAVHPGYGFLSENAAFARACAEAGLVFVGPSPDVIELMGDKARAKRAMAEAGLTVIPGYDGADPSDAAFAEAAAGIGYPVLVKAVAGGGGRGMRRVDNPEHLSEALAAARAESLAAFGRPDLMLEKAILQPRHVEVQIVGDAHGTMLHLGERECSIQRRYQKLIEETPCPALDPEQRRHLCAAAADAAAAIGYVGAGTLEFLLDADGRFYFLEMNTRLQVEHPVTEMVTGLDLVDLQFRVARGDPLELSQADIRPTGHAIEARLCTEDPANDFLPSAGRILSWHEAAGPGLRIDAGIATGDTVALHYDSLVAKIIAHGPTREAARKKLRAALAETHVFGPHSNSAFLTRALDHPDFVAGTAKTDFVDRMNAQTGLDAAPPDRTIVAFAAILHYLALRDAARRRSTGIADPLIDWSSTGHLHTPLDLVFGSAHYGVTVEPRGNGRYTVRDGDGRIAIRWRDDGALIADDRVLRHTARFAAPDAVYLSLDGRNYCFRTALGAAPDEAGTADESRVVAAMHGLIAAIAVDPGTAVKKGDVLATLEAMKMQHDVVARTDGVVKTIHCRTEDQVSAGQLLFDIASE